MSWFTHSGSTCYFGLPEEIILQEMLNALVSSQDLFLDATEIIVKALDLDKVIKDYHEVFPDLEELRKEVLHLIAIEILNKRHKSDS
jgi:uncharacterized radical SAM superfamily protein